MYGHLINLTIIAIVVYLFLHYPWSVGIRKAAECYTRLEAYRYGRHPQILDDLAGDDEDPYPEVAKLDSRNHTGIAAGMISKTGTDIPRVYPRGNDVVANDGTGPDYQLRKRQSNPSGPGYDSFQAVPGTDGEYTKMLDIENSIRF